MKLYISEAITLQLVALLWEHFMTQYASDLICVSNMCYCLTNNDYADTMSFNSALLYRYMNLELPDAAELVDTEWYFVVIKTCFIPVDF